MPQPDIQPLEHDAVSHPFGATLTRRAFLGGSAALLASAATGCL